MQVDKNLLLLAIENCDLYTLKQRQLLKVLVGLSVNNIVTTDTKFLTEKTQLSRPAVYLNIKKFCQEGLATTIRQAGGRQNSYQLNQEKLDYIVQLYQNKQKI